MICVNALVALLTATSAVSTSFFYEMNQLLQDPYQPTTNKAGKASTSVEIISDVVYPFVSRGSTFGLSETNKISWRNTQTPPDIVNMELWLGTGSSVSVTDLYLLTTVPFPSTTCYTFSPGADLDTGKQYTITIRGVGDSNYPSATACPAQSASAVKPMTSTATTKVPTTAKAATRESAKAHSASVTTSSIKTKTVTISSAKAKTTTNSQSSVEDLDSYATNTPVQQVKSQIIGNNSIKTSSAAIMLAVYVLI
ncbi:UNVERIFIED_CONTAM: hypothetical protein HDU68_006269 [Siphonaria sp. JEL0065]|nr:hypothetical protein HDU68_006269 [Siphonaria sp. JEL0065]